MTERPILFSSPMVKALLAGTKTMTRRIVKLREFGPSTTRGYDWTFRDRRSLWNDITHDQLLARCPYGVVGGRLWVRETWQAIICHSDGDIDVAAQIPKQPGGWGVVYAATDEQANDHKDDRGFVWRSPIHMPRWASRITLEITDVRVQRLQDISEDDAKAEGVPPDGMIDATINGELGRVAFFDPRMAFAHLWDAINGDGSWKANPWVWAIAFKRIEEIKLTDGDIDRTFAEAGSVVREVVDSLSTGGVKLRGQGGR